MFSLLEDQFIDDAVTRAEQSRVSYNTQTEEFRNLNANLQSYLGDIKTVDENNHQLQNNIEEIRTNYISTLENHLKLLPNDFREKSQELTEGHIERYRIKSRTRRINNEREELKRRINFIASNEKEQKKRLTILQKQEREVRNEFNKLNEQVQNLLKYVESEKQIHRQAMDKVDSLQIQHEQICFERSKTEFEIQTLREEVKLMQTAKEFIDEEREALIATQTEANEYLLSSLHESITRIREDFDTLNKTQLKQIENEYKQMFQTLEENLITNESNDETIAHQRAIQTELEQLRDEHQSAAQELTTINYHNKTLAERVLAMETDLHSLRDERMQQLLSKDNELQRSKTELQTLNEKLNHLAEYDRNLKFELTLYRGVLESEHRRKQQQKQSPISTSQVTRPTTLRSNNNSVTDRTTWLSNSTDQSNFNDQQQEQSSITRDRIQSDYDPFSEDAVVQIDEPVSKKISSNQEQQQNKINTSTVSQDTEKSSSGFSDTVRTEEQPTLTFESQQSSSRTSTTSGGTQKSPTASTPPILQENQSQIAEDQRLSTTPSELRTLPTLPTNIDSVSSEVRQSPSQEQQPSSRTSSISSKTSFDIPKSPGSPITSKVPEYQSKTSDVHESPSTPPQEQQPSSRTSSISSKTSSDVQKSPSSATTPLVPKYQSQSSEDRILPSTPPQEQQPSSRTSSISSKTSFDVQKSPVSPIASTVAQYQPQTSDVHQSPSTPPQEQQSSSHTSSISSKASSDVQKSPSATTPTVPKYQSQSSEDHILPSAPPQEQQPSSRTSSISSKTSFDIPKSPGSPITSKVPEYQPQTSDVHQSPSAPPQEHQPSSRISSTSSKTSSDVQKSPSSATSSTVPEYQSPSARSEDRQTSSEVQKSINTDIPAISTDGQTKATPITAVDSQTKVPSGQSGDEKQLTKSSDETNKNTQHEEKTTNEKDHREGQQSIHSIEPSSTEEWEISIETKPNESRSSSVVSISTPQDERKQSLSKSDTNVSPIQDKTLHAANREEQSNSSLANKTEEISLTGNISSTSTSNDKFNESNPLLRQDTGKESSHHTSLSNIAEVDSPSPSRKSEIKSDDDDENDDPNLAAVMQDVCYVFHDLANDEDLVEIDNDLPDKLLDRLEFRDDHIRLLFDSLLRKYLVQAAAQSNRPATLDWIEFRDILFPILCHRFTKRHIRQLFDLFDTNRDGYLLLQEITDLLEVLRVNDPISLAQTIVDEYDTDRDGKLSVDELIEAFEKTNNINEHVLSEETETKQWFNQSPSESQVISIEVPIINFSFKPDEKFTKGISLLGRIFKNVGANSDSKQLDSKIKNLTMEITNEFINNNVKISNDDLLSFIQLFIENKQKTDSLINWIEFRDVFLPIINNGFYFKNDIKRWFEILDTNHNGFITQEQVMQLLRLLQIQNPEEIIKKLNKTIETHKNNTASWTLDDLIFALDYVDETFAHLLTNNEPILSFDINWLSNTIF